MDILAFCIAPFIIFLGWNLGIIFAEIVNGFNAYFDEDYDF